MKESPTALTKALRGPNLVGTIKIALVVGTVLCLINQSHVMTEEVLLPGDYLRIFLNFLVPFSVATYSKVQVCRKQKLTSS